MKPIVGIMPLWDDEKESLWMLPGYLEGIKEAGGIPIIFPFLENKVDLINLINKCDGFLFTGGHDVNPLIYGEKPLNKSVIWNDKRDEMELFILNEAIKRNKSILGICRGIQFINAALGGSLYQDLEIEHKSDINHHQNAPYDLPIHNVNVIKNSPLFNYLNKETLAVNSLHHQAIKDLASCLKPMALSDDKLIEAIYLPNYKYLWAVQWHPEFSYKKDIDNKLIFTAFIESMKK